MGKPAARNTDMAMTCNDPTDLPVGTVIAVGTVMINKLPAAKQNDQVVGTDTHIIMIPTPGGPVPTPLPHPFVGMLNGGLSSSVNIMGMAAAVQGSTADAVPPHIPQGGPFQKPPANKATIQLGSTDVMIGNGGGGGSGQTDGGQAEQATSSAATTEGHRLDVKFVDKGGKPIVGPTYSVKGPDGEETSSTLAGKVKMTGVKEGDHEISLRAITKAAWSPDKARAGEKIKLQVEAVGVDDGTEVTLEVWKRDINRADQLVKTIKDLSLDGGKVEGEWEYASEEDVETSQTTKKRYSNPQYYFMAKVGDLQARSSILDYKDYVEIELRDADNNPVKNAKYILRPASGEIRKGDTGSSGKAKEEGIPPGKCRVEFPESGEVS